MHILTIFPRAFGLYQTFSGAHSSSRILAEPREGPHHGPHHGLIFTKMVTSGGIYTTSCSTTRTRFWGRVVGETSFPSVTGSCETSTMRSL